MDDLILNLHGVGQLSLLFNPRENPNEVTTAEFIEHFLFYREKNVWNKDGWLITGITMNKSFYQARRGYQVQLFTCRPEEVFLTAVRHDK